MRKVATVLLLAGLACAPAHANDSTAELSTGGLVFVKNDDIEMRAEDLYISTTEIRVRYRFFNRTGRDVTVRVAFPMPEIKVEHQDQDVAVPTDDPVNLLGFTTRSNGRAVQALVEQRVTAGGTDRTDFLTGLGIPLAPHARSTGEALDRLPRNRQDELVRLKLAEVEEYDAGKGMERHLAPRWSLRTTFHWQQTFPAQQETLIEHRYKPSVGGSVATAIGAGFAKGEPWHADTLRKYCVERDILNALDRARRAKGSDTAPFSEERIDYILKTGANWSGPIRDFRLVVDKGRPENMISFCGQGVRKIGPTQFEMRKTNFTPQGNLSVLILKPLPKE